MLRGGRGSRSGGLKARKPEGRDAGRREGQRGHRHALSIGSGVRPGFHQAGPDPYDQISLTPATTRTSASSLRNIGSPMRLAPSSEPRRPPRAAENAQTGKWPETWSRLLGFPAKPASEFTRMKAADRKST